MKYYEAYCKNSHYIEDYMESDYCCPLCYNHMIMKESKETIHIDIDYSFEYYDGECVETVNAHGNNIILESCKLNEKI